MNQSVHDKLAATARARKLITYTDLANAADLDVAKGPQLEQLVKILDELALEDIRARRPLLAVVVIRADTGMPSTGFFKFAKKNGLMKRTDDVGFFSSELARVYEAWAKA